MRPPARLATQFVKSFKDYSLEELRRYIDWTPFFSAWELKGRFPDILKNPASGEAARKLYDDAQRDARPDHRGEVAHGQRRHRVLAGQRRR